MKDLFSLAGKVAIITGGNGGIGKGIADGLATAGCDIVIAARNDEKTARAAQDIAKRFGVRVLGVNMDVASEDAVREGVAKAVTEFGKVNILVNNAGVNIRRMPEEYTVAEWDWIMNVNLRGAFLCAREVYPLMKSAGGGKIINVGSMTSLYGLAKVPVYACSKAAMVSLTSSLALAWTKDNIQVNAILPGWINTDLTISARRDLPGLEEFVLSRTPMRRWGTPEDFIGAAIFLASDASNYVTAEALRVDGGFAQSTNTVTFAVD